MYIVQLTYRVPLETVDELRAAHYDHLDKAFASGMYLIAGPLNPRTGGLILATGERSDVESFVMADPFVTTGAATAEITEFAATRISPHLASLAS